MSEALKLPFAVNLAVVIGINNYRNGFSPLVTARFDAERFARILKDSYHYEVMLLTDEQATSENIWNHLTIKLSSKIQSYQDKRQKVRLLFYFAGHGTPPQEEDKGGALVPQDAEATNQEKWLLMDSLKTALTNLKCDHLLIILDCCFAGSFRSSTRKFVFKKTEELSKERYDNYIKFSAAQVISSAAHDQTAADTYSFKDNRGKIENSGHSPFAYFLFKALEEQAADYTKDGITTTTELNLYLFEELQKGQQKQICRAWNLPTHDKGEFFFQTGDFDPNQLPDAVTLNKENNPYRGLESFNEAHSRFFFGRNEAIENLTNQITHQPLTIVLGSSGSGKSSLVKAGLIPKIREEQAQWQILDPIRLGSTPFTALAKALLPLILQCSHLNSKVLDQLYEVEKILGKKRREDSNNSELKGLFTQWRRTAPEDKLLLIIKNFELLKEVCGENLKQQKDLEYLRQLGLTHSRIVLENFYKLKDYCNSEEKQKLESFYRECQEIIARCSQDWSNKGKSFGSFFDDLVHKYLNNQKILLVIDQFEELITQSSEKKREEFLNALQSALKACPEQLRLIVTLRNDFRHDFENKPQLKDDWKNACFAISQMGRNQLREVIEEPASVQVLYFEEKEGKSLSEQLLDDIGDTPGVLPLLSFTLSELYYKYVQKERKDRTLRWEDYEELGGVTQALTNKATEEYENLKSNFENGGEKREIEPSEVQARQTLLRWIMLRMINLDGGVRTKRAVLEDELKYSEEETNNRRELVINRFVDARLFLTGTNLEGKTYFEPAHDILIREWDKIKAWLGGTAETVNETQEQPSSKWSWFGLILGNNQSKKESTLFDLNLQRQLTTAATEWDKNTRQGKSGEKRSKKAGGWLWNGNARLPLAREVLDSTDNWLNQVETEFVKSSLAKERQNRNRLIVGISGFIVVLLGGLFFSLRGQRNALIGQITASRQAAEANLLSNQNLDALISSLRAGDKLKNSTLLWLFPPDKAIQSQVRVSLQKAIAKVKERNIIEISGEADKVVFSPNGQLLGIITVDGTVSLWERTGKQLLEFKPFNIGGQVWSLSFTPDSQQIITVSTDEVVRTWDFNGQQIGEELLQPGIINQMMIGSNGRLIIFSSIDWMMRLRDLKNGNLLAEFPDNGIGYDMFSPNGKLIASGVAGDTIGIWDVKTQQKITEIKDFPFFNSNIPVSINFSPDSQLIAAAGYQDDTIYLWDLQGNQLAEFKANQNGIKDISFSPDGKQLASVGVDNTIRIWQDIEGKQLPELKIQGYQDAKDISISADGQLLATIDQQDIFHLWDLSKQQELEFPQLQFTNVSEINFSPDGNLLTVSESNGTIHLLDLENQKQLDRFQGNDIESAQGSFTRQNYGLFSQGLSYSQDGNLLAIGGDNTITVRSRTGQQLIEFPEDFSSEEGDLVPNWVQATAFAPSGNVLATGGIGGRVRLWNWKDGKQVLPNPIEANTTQTTSVVFSPQGDLLATAGFDGSAAWGRLWDLSGEQLAEFKDAIKIIFNPNGQLLATTSMDDTVRLWDLSGQELAQFKGFDWVESISFSADGNQVIVLGSLDGMWQLKQWPIEDLDQLIIRGCHWVGDYLQNNPNVSPDDKKLCNGIILNPV